MADTQLKNWYNKAFYDKLSTAFEKHYPSFNRKKFLALIFDEQWDNRELKERMHHTAVVIHSILSGSYAEKIVILNQIAPYCDDGFLGILFPDFVQTYGLEEANKEVSINALEHFTQYSSSEFAVRPFIIKYTDEMMAKMTEWTKHENHHVRRLASEGCRPRLPWAMGLPAFKKDPSLILPILEILKDDVSEYVRRSVANNLNDISKDHPDLVLKMAANWLGKSKEVDWVVKHACRTLLKQGNSQAMRLFGFAAPDNIQITNLQIENSLITIGEETHFSFTLTNSTKTTTKLRLEYGIYYMKSNGKQNRKVFKISEKEYKANANETIRKKQHFKNLTTRKHYEGEHKLSVIINGIEKEIVIFSLKNA